MPRLYGLPVASLLLTGIEPAHIRTIAVAQQRLERTTACATPIDAAAPLSRQGLKSPNGVSHALPERTARHIA